MPASPEHSTSSAATAVSITDLLSELPSRLSTPSPAPRPVSTSVDATPDRSLGKKLLKEQRQREKEAKKVAKKLEGPKPVPAPVAAPLRFLPREWTEVEPLEGEDPAPAESGRKVSILTWNMLAQALVRRELFPNSDFLKVKDRIPTLMQEVLYYAPDIACLQEVDRLSDHLPSLTLTHSYTSFIGYPNKPHGLLIAHKNTVFEKIGERGLRLDELPIDDTVPPPPCLSPTPSTPTSPDAPSPSLLNPATRRAVGLSRSTRNVALFVALKFKTRLGGIIVGTTHLFWHPQHVYERVRQTGILMREARKFRQENTAWRDWPVFVAGDFNTQPQESTYRLLMGLPLTASQEADLARSTVVHESVDKLHEPSFISAPEDAAGDADGIADGNLEQHPDRVIRNARAAEESDGLVGLRELRRLFEGGGTVRSAYGECYGRVEGEEGKRYVDRTPEVHSGSGWAITEKPEVVKARKKGTWEERVRRGDFEPRWTNFTPLWRCTLDYIFLLPPTPSSNSESKAEPRFTALLRTHSTEEMGLGLPRKGVEPSDHVALGAVVEIF